MYFCIKIIGINNLNKKLIKTGDSVSEHKCYEITRKNLNREN